MINKTIKLIAVFLSVTIIAGIGSSVNVKAMTAEEQFLRVQMQAQMETIAAAQAYFVLQEAVSRAEGRKISDIEMVKRQALEGVIQGDYRLLEMGDRALSVGYPSGMANIAYMDQAAMQGVVSGLKDIEEIKRKTWMTYTWRTH